MTRLKKFHAIGDFLHLLKQAGDISEDYTKSNILLQFRKKRRNVRREQFPCSDRSKSVRNRKYLVYKISDRFGMSKRFLTPEKLFSMV